MKSCWRCKELLAFESGFFYCLPLLRPLHFPDRVMKIVRVLKAPVNRGKADICHLVQFIQFLHYHLADPARRYLAFAQTQKLLHNTVHGCVHLSGGNRTLVQRSHETGQQFLAIELGAVAILFYYLGQTQFHRFICGKAFIAYRAAAAAAYSVAFLAYPGVDYACVICIAEGAFHDSYSSQENEPLNRPVLPIAYCRSPMRQRQFRPLHKSTLINGEFRT